MMDKAGIEKVKRSRKSTPRSRGGCLTCKFRKVKCDERRPTCVRCESFAVICDGYVEAQKPAPKRARGGPLKLLPKHGAQDPVTSAVERSTTLYETDSEVHHRQSGSVPFIPASLLPIHFDSEAEQRYFDLFQEKTSVHIAPYSDSETWRLLVLQACTIDSIRHAVIAIAALHKTSMTVQNYKQISLDFSDTSVLNEHHKMAIDQYTKAIRSMRKAMSGGKQDLRTTILTCLVIACFEAFHGNMPLAHGQIRTGIELLNEWKMQYGELYTISFASPNPDVVEDALVNTFGRLEIATGYAYSDKPDIHEIRGREMSKILKSMPPRFENLTKARVYLELIFRQLEHYIYISATWPDTVHQHSKVEERTVARLKERANERAQLTVEQQQKEAKADSPASSATTYPPEYIRLNHYAKLRNWGGKEALREHKPNRSEPEVLEESFLYSEVNYAGDYLTAANLQRDTHLAELLQWNYSFQAMLVHSGTKDNVGSMMMQLHFKICYVCIKTYSDDLMEPDKYTEDMYDIVSLAKRILAAVPNGESTNFTLDFGINIPIYIVGFKCRISSLRHQIIDLLLTHPRREGFWDSRLAGQIVRWIQSLEEEFVGTEYIPEWARIRPSEVGFRMKGSEQGERKPEDLFGREAELVYYQRISPDTFETRERRLNVTW